MPQQDLLDYISYELEEGIDRQSIIDSLLKQGWEKAQINEAFDFISNSHNTPPPDEPYPSSKKTSLAKENIFRTGFWIALALCFLEFIIILYLLYPNFVKSYLYLGNSANKQSSHNSQEATTNSPPWATISANFAADISPAITIAQTLNASPTPSVIYPTIPVASSSSEPTVEPGNLPLLGNPNAKVTIIEFTDFRGPFSAQWFTDTWPSIVKDYINTGKIKFAFRQYAFLGPASTVAANASECANDQGKFWEYHDWLLSNQPPETDTSMYTTADLTKEAVSLGLDGTKFQTCLVNQTDESKITADYSDGQKAGVTGTPSFFVNGNLLVGAQPYSTFQTAIDQALSKTN